MADADPDAAKVGTQMLIDRAQAVVSCSAAAALHFDLERGEVEFVVKYGERLYVELVKAQRFTHRAAAFVHVRRRLQEQYLVAADPAFLQPALELLLHGPEAMHLGDDVERHEADVVPVHRVLRTGISEANPELHRGSL